MDKEKKTVFISVLFTVINLCLIYHPTQAQNRTCASDGPCRCVMSDGSGAVDISSLGNNDSLPRFPNSPSYDGISYAYNPCYPANVGDCKNSAVCRMDNGKYVGLGTQESAQWSFRGYYPIITYISPSRKTEIMLICDLNFTSPLLTVIGEFPGGKVGMMLSSQCACPGACPRVNPPSGPSSALSPGSILVVVFFSLLVAYLLVGTTVNCTRPGKTGKELLPNYDSWSILPSLILDGFQFVRTVICCGKASSYEPM